MFARKRLTRTAVYLAPAGCAAVVLAWFLLPGGVPRAVAQQGTMAAAETVVRVYPCPPAGVQAVAAQLRQEFQGTPGMRIAPYEQLGQILVEAPADVQSLVAWRLTPPPQNVKPVAYEAPAPVPQATPSAPSAATRSQSIQLRHVTASQIESALINTLGDRLTPLSAGTQSVRDYRLALPGGGQLSLSIDYQGNSATVQGTGAAVDSSLRMIQALDVPKQPVNRSVEAMSMGRASPTAVRQVIDAIRAGTIGPRTRLAGAFQPGLDAFEGPIPGEEEVYPLNGGQPPLEGEPAAPPMGEIPPETGLVGPVYIEMIPGLDVLIIQGNKRDVDRVMEVIEEVERLSAETEPVIVVHDLQYVQSEAIVDLILPLYQEVYEPRQGTVSITALVKPNSLLLVGRRDNIQTVQELVSRLDRPVSPEAEFRIFRLRHASAVDAQASITEFFGTDGIGLSARVIVTAEYRSNSLIVRAGPRDMLEVARLIERIDTSSPQVVNELRVFPLYNSYAENVEFLLEEAISGTAVGADTQPLSQALSFTTVDLDGQRRYTSGILSDVRITSDATANTLLISAPAESMDLLEAVIRQLDQPPVAETQIKVFTIVNGDAYFLRTMLETLFEAITANQTATQTGALAGESSLISLRFVEDVRTNSLVVAGSAGDLMVVDAILTRLDESEIRNRKTRVYWLKNAPAEDVATAVNDYLTGEIDILSAGQGEMMSYFDQVKREVVVIPMTVNNSLIVSATPRFYDEITALIEDLDRRPPMVMIQVVLAEVGLNDTDEFGVELGLQDSLLFDRSQLTNLNTLTTTTTTQQPGGATVTTESQEIISADVTPGYAFGNPTTALPNTGVVLEAARILASQGLSHFGVGRVNSDLGYGGLVLSASSDVLSILVRALQEERRLEVLSRPQIMAVDNQPAYIMVGQTVPLISGVTTAEAGQTYTTSQQDVGLILSVTARTSPDNMVMMELTAEKSAVGPEKEGVPVSISASGEVVRTPRIDRTSAETTVLAADGQTVVIGGLITKSKSFVTRKVPVLGDVPLLGTLFRYDSRQDRRAELLIILTPHVVRSQEDAEMIKQIEAARMNWCICDVIEFADDPGLRSRTDEWRDSETSVVYPDMDANGQIISMPEEPPQQQPTVAPPNGGSPLPESAPGNGRLSPQSNSAAPLQTPRMQASPGTSPLAVSPPPTGPAQTLPPIEPVGYQPQSYPTAAGQNAYQWTAPGAAELDANARLGIQLPRDAQPAEYWQPYQPPAAQPSAQQQIPSYR